MTGGRRWAYAAAWFGGVASVAANVAHAFVPPEGAPADWRPHPGSVVGAVFWPVALFLVFEVVTHVDWPAGRRWVWLRFGGLAPVAVVAATVSYQHLSGLLAYYEHSEFAVKVGPLAVDGLMLVASGALLATAGRAEAADARPVEAPADAPAAHPVQEPATVPPARPVVEDRPPAQAETTRPPAAPHPGGRTQLAVVPSPGKGTRPAGKVPARTDREDDRALLLRLKRDWKGEWPPSKTALRNAAGVGDGRAVRLAALAKELGDNLREDPEGKIISARV